jgi:hypothetical protein
MCLLKVVMKKTSGKETVAKEIVLAVKNGENIELYDQMLNKVSVVEKAEIVGVDMLNETLTLAKHEA